MDARPSALLTTWTCYGTWLPGDERGHVSNVRHATGGFTRKQNETGTPYTAGDQTTRTLSYAAQKYPTVLLTPDEAFCVAESLVAATAKRNWTILRAAVMANHAHVLTTNCPNDGPAVRRILKGVTQAALSSANGSPRQWWTEGGSDRYKNDDEAILTAIRYVENQERVLAGIRDMVPFRC